MPVPERCFHPTGQCGQQSVSLAHTWLGLAKNRATLGHVVQDFLDPIALFRIQPFHILQGRIPEGQLKATSASSGSFIFISLVISSLPKHRYLHKGLFAPGSWP